MNLLQQPKMVISIVCLAIVLCGAWSWENLYDQQTAASAAAMELADCRGLCRQISAGRLNTSTAPRPDDITTAIASAAAQAGLAEGSLDHIDPGSARRNPDGTSSQRQIDLSIRQATLRQVVTFARALSIPPLSLQASQLRLTPSQSDNGGWTAQMTLTYPPADDLKE